MYKPLPYNAFGHATLRPLVFGRFHFPLHKLIIIIINEFLEFLLVLPLLIRTTPSNVLTHFLSKLFSAHFERRKFIDTTTFS